MNKARTFRINNGLSFLIIAAAGILLGFAFHGSISALELNRAPFLSAVITHPQSLPSNTNPLTLIEALKIAQSYALTVKPDAKLLNLVSSDVGDSTSKNAGLDGKRRTWIASFNLDSNKSGLRLQVTDGAIVEADKTPYPIDLPVILDSPLIDSPAALQVALKNKIDFSPSADPRGQGFHFGLQADDKGYPLFTIIGASQQTRAMVNVDGTTGSFLSAKRYELASLGSVLYSSDAGMSWHKSDLNKRYIFSIVEDPSQKDVAYASANENGSIVIYTSKNGGMNWSFLSQMPPEAGNWAYNLVIFTGVNGERNLLVGTINGLWSSRDFGNTWKAIDTKPAGTPQWMSVIKSQGNSLLILCLPDATPSLYVSKDLVTWTKLADDANRLSRSFDGKSVIATDDENSSPALNFDGKSIIEIPVPPHTLRFAGDFSNPDNMLGQTADTIYSRNGTNWASQITGNVFASISASPDYLADGLVIAGGFRTGIYRSVDYGHTWQEIANQQLDILSDGTGEIPYVVFLSNQDAILVNGGEFTWLDY